jgi:hypothetical protein
MWRPTERLEAVAGWHACRNWSQLGAKLPVFSATTETKETLFKNSCYHGNSPIMLLAYDLISQQMPSPPRGHLGTLLFSTLKMVGAQGGHPSALDLSGPVSP